MPATAGVRVASDTKSASPPFTAAIDGLIVKGFLANRSAMIKKLIDMGFARGDILDRARQLGLTDQFIKRCAVGNPRVAMRPCLRCGQRFLSMGIQNRLCTRCKNIR